jgi:integrase
MDIVPTGAPIAPEPANNGTGRTPTPGGQAPDPAGQVPDLTDPVFLSRVVQQLVRIHTDARDTRIVQEVIDTYLSNVGNEINAQTLELRKRTLKLFGQQFGTLQVSQCTPIMLKKWLAERSNWASGWTKMRVHADIQRIFNSAATLRFIRENPFKGLRVERSRRMTGRDMHPEEFQAILRVTDPAFRRVLCALKMTGMRPGELRCLRWCHIDWEKGLAVLERHKTARSTGKPRIIVFPPAIMKLLAWIYRHRKGPAAVELQRILQASPNRTLGACEVSKKMFAKGFSARQIYGARRLIGAKLERVGGWGAKGRTVYSLPVHPVEELAAYEDYVFLCGKKRPWKRYALCHKFKLLRKQLGLPMACRLHGLRHAFITEGVRRNVNMKALATLVGHSDTRMIESTYCHVGEDFAFLRTAALQALGQSATADQVIEQPQPAPAPGDGAGVGAQPAVKTGADAGQDLVRLVQLLIRQNQTLEAKLKAAESKPQLPKDRVLKACEQLAYDAAHWAIAQKPELAHATDEQIYEWLHARPEYRAQLPPTAVTFSRYLKTARKLLDGCSKRESRRKGWKPPETNGQAETGGTT